MFCRHCGVENSDDSKFCRACGQPLEESAAPRTDIVRYAPLPTSKGPQKAPKNTAALIFAIIGAVLGIFLGLIWSSSALFASNFDGSGLPTDGNPLWGFLFLLFGIGGGILTLLGGIQAFGCKNRTLAVVLSFIGFGLQFLCFVSQIAMFGASATLWIYAWLWTIFPVALSLTAACLSLKKPLQNE